MRCCADNRIERRRQCANNFLRLLVARRARDEDPAISAMDSRETGKRLPDAVRRMTDIDHAERVVPDDFQPARPSHVAQTCAYRSLDSVAILARLLALQPACVGTPDAQLRAFGYQPGDEYVRLSMRTVRPIMEAIPAAGRTVPTRG